jgi:hypothetical protein
MVDPISFDPVPIIAAPVPSVKVPSPSFHHSLLYPKSAAQRRST